MKRIVDFTRPSENAMPVYPGEPPKNEILREWIGKTLIEVPWLE